MATAAQPVRRSPTAAHPDGSPLGLAPDGAPGPAAPVGGPATASGSGAGPGAIERNAAAPAVTGPARVASAVSGAVPGAVTTADSPGRSGTGRGPAGTPSPVAPADPGNPAAGPPGRVSADGQGPSPRGAGAFPRLREFGPQWYAAVMGTASVAVAGWAVTGSGGPVRVPLAAVWALSAVLLAAVATARALHWRHHRDRARAHLHAPAVVPFYGCAAMAPLAVGIGALGPGREVVGDGAALPVAVALFAVGCAVAVLAAAAVPYLLVVRDRPAPGGPADEPSPVWLLPLVAPMVAAAFGPLLAASAPDGEPRRTLLVVSLGLAGASGVAALVVLPLVLARLFRRGPLPLALTPSLLLVLGPLGQSTTAANQLADALPGRPYAGLVAVGYGVPVMGFALLWLALTAAMLVRAARRGLPFTLGWWAFTFPVGTCVTGAAALAQRTGLTLLWVVAAALYALLVTGWAVAGWRTARGLLSGALPAAPPTAPGAPLPATARTRSAPAR